MYIFKRTVWLCAALSLSACGGPEESTQSSPEADALAEQSRALTTGTSQGCTFTISTSQIPGAQPPRWNINLSRAASGTCAWPASSVVLGQTYSLLPISLAANDLGVATGFAYRHSPSGSSNTQCLVTHTAPDTLSTVRTSNIVVNWGAGNVNSCNVAIAGNGTTLTAGGTKTGPLPGETGSGNNYVATWLNFFTSTTAPTFFAY